MSGSSNFPGGGSRPLCFIVSRLFGVRGRGSLDEFLLSCWVVRALELIMYMHSYINVSKLDESSQVDFLSQRIPCSTFLTVRIKCPMRLPCDWHTERWSWRCCDEIPEISSSLLWTVHLILSGAHSRHRRSLYLCDQEIMCVVSSEECVECIFKRAPL